LVNAFRGFKIAPLLDEPHVIAVGSREYLYLGEVAGAFGKVGEGLGPKRFDPKNNKEKNFLDMKETIKSEIDKENVNEYINGYLKSRNLKKEDLKRREHTKQKEDLIQQLKKRSNLSKRKITILIRVNRETVRKVSKEPSP